MTPEERARAVVAAWYRGPYNIHSFDPNDEERRIEIATIAAAIRDAVAAEREATIKALVGVANDVAGDDVAYYAGYKAAVRNSIAAIRGRGTNEH